MKKTPMMNRSPRPFHLGLGLLFAAALAALPLLTGASASPSKTKPTNGNPVAPPTIAKAMAEPDGPEAGVKMRPVGEPRTAGDKPPAVPSTKPKSPAGSKGSATPKPKAVTPPAPGTSKTTKPTVPKTKNSPSKAAKASTVPPPTELDREAKRIAATLTPTQRTKLLKLLNEADIDELAAIGGVGKSRSVAIEKARPLDAIEDVRRVRGVGLKTFEGMVDHGKTLTGARAKAPSTSKPAVAPASSAKPRAKGGPTTVDNA